jgi:hypothetical protein
VLKKKQQIKKMGQNIRRVAVERFDKDNLATQALSVLKTLVKM